MNKTFIAFDEAFKEDQTSRSKESWVDEVDRLNNENTFSLISKTHDYTKDPATPIRVQEHDNVDRSDGIQNNTSPTISLNSIPSEHVGDHQHAGT